MKKSKLFPQMQFLVEKVKRLYGSGRFGAITLDIDGKRINGKEVKELKFEKNQISFKFEDVTYSIPYCELLDVKRLRTRKYLFYVTMKNDGKAIGPANESAPVNEEVKDLPEGLNQDSSLNSENNVSADEVNQALAADEIKDFIDGQELPKDFAENIEIQEGDEFQEVSKEEVQEELKKTEKKSKKVKGE